MMPDVLRPTPDAPDTCLNCHAVLSGPYCAQCGQRQLPAYPTVREFAGDAWEEVSGWDGRIARTVRLLLRHPGRLTHETLSGRRSRYIKPLRLYLWASVAYFVIAAVAPNVITRSAATVPGSEVRINLSDPRAIQTLTPAQREQMLTNIERAPAVLRPLFASLVTDPVGFRERVVATVPKAVFVLVMAFAGIASLFYRHRTFVQHLTFALHIHAAVFLALTMVEVTQFTGIVWIIQAMALLAIVYLAWHVVQAQRTAYGRGLAGTLLTSLGMALVYLLVWVPVMAAVLTWAVWRQ